MVIALTAQRKLDSLSKFLPTWQGEAGQQECDELGHLNMRHYMTKAQQARQMFIMQLGLVHAFEVGTSSTVRVREFHIKYMREAMPGAPLRIETAITRIGTSDITLLHVMYHGDGSLAATIREQLEHLYLPTHKSFAWPERLLKNAKAYLVETPDYALPRGLPDTEMTGANQETLDKWDCHTIGRGVFQRWEIGNSGTVCAQHVLGRLSGCIRHYDYAWPEGIFSGNVVGVLLEIRFRFHTFAKSGDPFVLRSGLLGSDDKIRQLVHHMVNPVTDKPIGSFIAVNALIDLEKRKLVLPSAENQKILQDRISPNLHA